jgi:hypothetical protein
MPCPYRTLSLWVNTLFHLLVAPFAALGVLVNSQQGFCILDGSITRVISASQFVGFLIRIEHERVALRKNV